MNIVRRYITRSVFGCIAAAVLLPSQLDAQALACAETVLGIYKRLTGPIPSPGSATRLRYTIRTTSKWQEKTQTTTSNVEMIASETRLYMASEQMELGQDATTAVIVLPGRQSININGSNLERFREMRDMSLGGIRDSVLMTSDVVECTSRTDGVAGANQKTTFRLKPGPRKRFKMESVTIYLNSAKQTIQKILFAPTSDNKVTSIEIVFNAIEYEYKTDHFSRPLLSQFIGEDGRPLPRYKGYTVSDARKSHR